MSSQDSAESKIRQHRDDLEALAETDLPIADVAQQLLEVVEDE
jgi:hypothetical protein